MKPVQTRWFQWIGLTWFVVISLTIVVCSYQLVRNYIGTPRPESFPLPAALRNAPQIDYGGVKDPVKRVDLYTKEAAAYKFFVTSYQQQVESYKAHATADQNRITTVYALVIKDTLMAMITTAVSAIIGFIFVRAGAESLTSYLETKKAEAGR